jgi:choline dehydrogenase-like flavoprotein
MNVFTNLISPMARGNVTLLSNSVWDHPAINPNLLGHPFDMDVMVYAIKAAARFVAAPAWDNYIVTRQGAFGGATTDDELKAYASANAGT